MENEKSSRSRPNSFRANAIGAKNRDDASSAMSNARRTAAERRDSAAADRAVPGNADESRPEKEDVSAEPRPSFVFPRGATSARPLSRLKILLFIFRFRLHEGHEPVQVLGVVRDPDGTF